MVKNKRPSWLNGRSIDDTDESSISLKKRPSWLVGRSFKGPIDSRTTIINDFDINENMSSNKKRPSWLHGKRTSLKHGDLRKIISRIVNRMWSQRV